MPNAENIVEIASARPLTTDLRAILAAHVALQFVNGRRLRPADDVQQTV
jgi:hypothetical protein